MGSSDISFFAAAWQLRRAAAVHILYMDHGTIILLPSFLRMVHSVNRYKTNGSIFSAQEKQHQEKKKKRCGIIISFTTFSWTIVPGTFLSRVVPLFLYLFLWFYYKVASQQKESVTIFPIIVPFIFSSATRVTFN